MSLLQRGSTGSEVEAVQDHLRRHGFDAPGTFGAATEAAVVAFQKHRGLLPDGIVGPVTRAALEGRVSVGSVDARDADAGGLRIDRTFRLPETQYVPEPQRKDLVVLHHTAGGTARSTFEWWKNEPGNKRIATAYIVERDGTIYEVFDPRHWAYHLGLGGTAERRSIGIELASEGALWEDGSRLLAFNPDPTKARVYGGDVYEHGSSWRGHRHFAAYTDAQVDAAVALTNHLLDVFGIERRAPAARHDFHEGHKAFRGVIGHHHVRADKTDLHPGFPWDRLCSTCELAEV